MPITELDFSWYWLGYSMGVNSRKVLEPSADKLINYGKQGVITIPTPKQQVSFFCGVQAGRRVIVNSFNIIKVITTQGKKGLNTADMLTFGIQEKEGNRGEYIDILVYITKNAAENRGVAAFQLDLDYDSDFLDFISITKSDAWSGSFESTSRLGNIQAVGQKDVVGHEDIILCTMRFYVKDTVSESTSKIPLNIRGSVGTGLGSELLTLINDELYFITPLNLKAGGILLESKEPEKIGEITIPSTGSTIIGSGDSSVDFEFSANVSGPAGFVGSGGGTGVSATINVKLDGVIIGTTIVDLELGDGVYKGKIPIKLPNLSTGKITYEIVIEDESGFHYVFIRAGALFKLNTEIKREEVSELSDLKRLRVLKSSLNIVGITTMDLVQYLEPLNVEQLSSNLNVGSITTLDLVTPLRPLNVEKLSSNLNLGSITTIKQTKNE